MSGTLYEKIIEARAVLDEHPDEFDPSFVMWVTPGFLASARRSHQQGLVIQAEAQKLKRLGPRNRWGELR